MEDFIQLQEKNVLRYGIKDINGNDTGVVIKFDLQDMEMPLRINKMEAMHKKNQSILRQQAIALDKQEDKKGKFLLSWKQEQQIKLLNEFYSKDMEALDLLIGDGMTQKILDAINRKPYYDMFDDIVAALEPALDMLNKEAEAMFDNIVKKYGIDENNII